MEHTVLPISFWIFEKKEEESVISLREWIIHKSEFQTVSAAMFKSRSVCIIGWPKYEDIYQCGRCYWIRTARRLWKKDNVSGMNDQMNSFHTVAVEFQFESLDWKVYIVMEAYTTASVTDILKSEKSQIHSISYNCTQISPGYSYRKWLCRSPLFGKRCSWFVKRANCLTNATWLGMHWISTKWSVTATNFNQSCLTQEDRLLN